MNAAMKVIAVSSGKGGVGKSTFSSNLAIALALEGANVAILDADIHGPNLPTMLGVTELPKILKSNEGAEKLLPPETFLGIKVLSMGSLVDADVPMLWRGPMVHSALKQFATGVDWGDAEWLILDLPPGTGDVQLSVTELFKPIGTIVVTTPQEISLQDVRKAIRMWQQVKVQVLGIVENMSGFVCGTCDTHHDLFGTDGGKRLAENFKIPFLGSLPLEKSVRESADLGKLVLKNQPESVFSRNMTEIVRNLMKTIMSRAEAHAPVHTCEAHPQ